MLKWAACVNHVCPENGLRHVGCVCEAEECGETLGQLRGPRVGQGPLPGEGVETLAGKLMSYSYTTHEDGKISLLHPQYVLALRKQVTELEKYSR